MTAPSLRWPTTLRWAAVVPVALLAAGVVQAAFMALGLLVATPEYAYADGSDWVLMTIKSVASVFMCAAFVGAAAWTAPANRHGLAVVAVTVVLAWALVPLVLDGSDGAINPGHIALRGAGIAGALAVAALVARRGT